LSQGKVIRAPDVHGRVRRQKLGHDDQYLMTLDGRDKAVMKNRS